MSRSCFYACLVLSMGMPARAAEASPQTSKNRVDFARDIQPILTSRCTGCHGPKEQEGGLRLDVRRRAMLGGDSGRVIVPGSAEKSALIELVTAEDESEAMPPEGEPLSKKQIALLKAWITQGAPWPDDLAGTDTGDNHWAFQAIKQPPPPVVKATGWIRNPIDTFVLARLERKAIPPSPPADRTTLIRRLKLDLLGLPPTPEEVDTFLEDSRIDAYERLVDKFLASPHFGERWGRHWLDLARYADSGGYEADTPRSIWRYRNWVIDALNADVPFNQFVIEQLAGDLLPNATDAQRTATGFHCNAMFDPGLRWEALIERVNTTGTLFLGLTVGCAQCHSHKTDPISQREFYQLFAFFNSTRMGTLEFASARQRATRDAQQKQIEELKAERETYRTSLKETLWDWATTLSTEARNKLSPQAQQALAKPAGQRAEAETKVLLDARISIDEHHKKLSGKIDALTQQLPKFPSTLAMHHAPQPTRIFIRGNHEQPGEQVSPNVPSFLPRLANVENPTRLHLAHWLVAPEHPLTARVAVNRFWQRYFGRGLVEIENDFGIQTPPATHPELLDWLASRFMQNGWSVKAIHRLIVCSATYRQASHLRPELGKSDPYNYLLARQRRFRVEAEILRDASLSVSDLLSRKIGGPSVFPYQPEGVLDFRATKAHWKMSTGEDRLRRGMYTWFWRLTPHPMLVLFDAPDGTAACTRRERSNTPVQALTLLNDPTFVECARALAARVLREATPNQQQQLQHAFRTCLAREPQPAELQLLTNLLNEQLHELAETPEAAKKIVGENPPATINITEQAAWIVVCRTLLNLDEFLTRE